jgi:hypothetical protein
MSGFILGIAVGIVINLVTALFSRDKALKLLPWLLLYIMMHGSAVLLNADFMKGIVMEEVKQFKPYGWLSYAIVILLSGCIGGIYWKASNLFVTRLAQHTDKPLPKIDDTAQVVRQDKTDKSAAPHPERLTLHKLFLEDFNGPSLGFGFAPRELAGDHGERISVEARLFIELEAGSKFVSIYVPQSPFAYGACEFLADSYQEVGGLNLFHLEVPGPTGTIFTERFKFSGRIFIYHEANFTPEQIGDLYRLYKGKDLLLELRGQGYVATQTLLRSAKAASQEKGH